MEAFIWKSFKRRKIVKFQRKCCALMRKFTFKFEQIDFIVNHLLKHYIVVSMDASHSDGRKNRIYDKIYAHKSVEWHIWHANIYTNNMLWCMSSCAYCRTRRRGNRTKNGHQKFRLFVWFASSCFLSLPLPLSCTPAPKYNKIRKSMCASYRMVAVSAEWFVY